MVGFRNVPINFFSDLSYEDLAMRFLYWPNGAVTGEEKLKTRNCWKVRLQNPKPGTGRYALVYVWVDKMTGALIQVVGYNDQDPAKALKRFHVQKIMPVRQGPHLAQNAGRKLRSRRKESNRGHLSRIRETEEDRAQAEVREPICTPTNPASRTATQDGRQKEFPGNKSLMAQADPHSPRPAGPWRHLDEKANSNNALSER